MNPTHRKLVHAACFWVLSLTGLALLFMVVALPVIEKRRAMETMVEQMTARNVALYGEFDRVEKERIALTSGDPFYLEKLARERLHMVRAGEQTLFVEPAALRREIPEPSVDCPRPLTLCTLAKSLGALAEDRTLRQIALALGALVLLAAVVMFGRGND